MSKNDFSMGPCARAKTIADARQKLIVYKKSVHVDKKLEITSHNKELT